MKELQDFGILHRDVKLQNFVLVNGCVKIVDFGLARLKEEDPGQVGCGGTPEYQAPEIYLSWVSPPARKLHLDQCLCTHDL